MEQEKKKRRKLGRREQSVAIFEKIAKESYMENIKKKRRKLVRGEREREREREREQSVAAFKINN